MAGIVHPLDLFDFQFEFIAKIETQTAQYPLTVSVKSHCCTQTSDHIQQYSIQISVVNFKSNPTPLKTSKIFNFANNDEKNEILFKDFQSEKTYVQNGAIHFLIKVIRLF